MSDCEACSACAADTTVGGGGGTWHGSRQHTLNMVHAAPMAENILMAVVSGRTVAAKLHERVLAGYDKESRALQLYYTEYKYSKAAVWYKHVRRSSSVMTR